MDCITIRCGGSQMRVPAAALDTAPALKIRAAAASADNGGVVEVNRDPNAFWPFVAFITQQALPSAVTPALLAELEYWGAAFAAPLSRVVRPSDGAMLSLQADVNAFADWLAHTAICTDDGQRAPCAAALLLPCANYLHDDTWGEAVDAFKYTVAHPRMFRAAMLRRWGMDVVWSGPRSAVSRVTEDAAVFVGAQPLLVRKAWDSWEASPGAFGIPDREHDVLLDYGVTPCTLNGAAHHLSGDTFDLRVQVTSAAGGVCPSIQCSMEGSMQFVELHVFFFVSEQEVQSWKVYMRNIGPGTDNVCAGIALSDSHTGRCPFPHEALDNAHDMTSAVYTWREGVEFVGFAAVSSWPQALILTESAREDQRAQYTGETRVCELILRMVL
ncbi:hypothetical protein JKP88DRAFT_272930 [Tribonema minus]|uniref:Uncharacterized protein n=1 Tax=Tribonema minus TaxID=303371 RepID=A0A836CES2_9STRA|nr:hypothetical protein JKP88DRAFT_272930 [Tribonema minus]